MAKTEPPKQVGDRLKAMIHVAKKDLGLAEEDYRTVLFALTGKESCAEMSVVELNKVLEAFRAKGWIPKVKSSTRNFDPNKNDPRLKKIWKLWYLLEESGKIKSPNAKALNAFCKKVAGVERMEWLQTSEQFEAVTEGLKAWLERDARKNS